MALVTVVLPVHNAERYLAAAVDSVLEQSCSDFELLAIDDGSSDRSSEILAGFRDSRLRILKNEANLRLIRTLNRGLAEARGAFIARMDADDLCFPRRLERQLDYFSRHPEVAVLGSYAVRIDEQGHEGRMIRSPTGADLAGSVWWPTPLIHPTVMMRRSVVEAGFTYREDSLHCEDYELWIRLSRAGLRLENLAEPLLYYRVHSAGITLSQRELQLENSYAVFRRYYPEASLAFAEYRALIGAGGRMGWRRRMALLKTITHGTPPAHLRLRQLKTYLRGLYA